MKNYFSLKIRNKTRCKMSLLLLKIILEVLIRAIRQEKRNRRHPNQKERSKTVFLYDMELYVKNKLSLFLKAVEMNQ